MIKEIYIQDKSSILEIWGEAFEPLWNHPNVKFSSDHIQVTLVRTKPITLSDSPEQTKVIKLEEPDLKILKMMDAAKGDVSKVAILIQGACVNGIPAASADKIKASDFMLLSKVVSCFLGDTQKISGT